MNLPCRFASNPRSNTRTLIAKELSNTNSQLFLLDDLSEVSWHILQHRGLIEEAGQAIMIICNVYEYHLHIGACTVLYRFMNTVASMTSICRSSLPINHYCKRPNSCRFLKDCLPNTVPVIKENPFKLLFQNEP